MIQDIYPSKLDNSYKNIKPEGQDFVLLFDDEGKAYLGSENGKMAFLTYSDIAKKDDITFTFLFSIDDKKFFLI